MQYLYLSVFICGSNKKIIDTPRLAARLFIRLILSALIAFAQSYLAMHNAMRAYVNYNKNPIFGGTLGHFIRQNARQ